VVGEWFRTKKKILLSNGGKRRKKSVGSRASQRCTEKKTKKSNIPDKEAGVRAGAPEDNLTKKKG